MKTVKVLSTDTIAQALAKNSKAGEILWKEGLLCVGCGMAQYETLEQGCTLHGIDVKEVLSKINGTPKKKAKKINAPKKSLKAKKR